MDPSGVWSLARKPQIRFRAPIGQIRLRIHPPNRIARYGRKFCGPFACFFECRTQNRLVPFLLSRRGFSFGGKCLDGVGLQILAHGTLSSRGGFSGALRIHSKLAVRARQARAFSLSHECVHPEDARMPRRRKKKIPRPGAGRSGGLPGFTLRRFLTSVPASHPSRESLESAGRGPIFRAAHRRR